MGGEGSGTNDVINLMTTMLYQPMLDFLIAEGKTSPRDMIVFCAIARYMNKDGRGAFPSTASLAFQLHLTERSVQRCLKSLVDKQCITPTFWKRHSTAYEIGPKLIPHKDFRRS